MGQFTVQALVPVTNDGSEWVPDEQNGRKVHLFMVVERGLNTVNISWLFFYYTTVWHS
jgi:hypothetical protein